MTQTIWVVTTSPTTPYDWDPGNNKVELVGAGAAGQARQSTSLGGIGGGGGAYTQQANVTLTAGTITVTVPAANAGTATSFVKAGDSVNITANSAAANSPTGGAAGGSNTINRAGGTGNTPGLASGGGGGGAGGPTGAGSNAAAATATLSVGGNADGSVVTAPAAAGAGNSGTEFDGSHGCGTGASGQNGAGFAGGLYGGGGAGHGATSTGTTGTAGTAGLVSATWTPRPNLPLQNSAGSNPILWVDRPRQLPRVPDPPIPNLLGTTLTVHTTLRAPYFTRFVRRAPSSDLDQPSGSPSVLFAPAPPAPPGKAVLSDPPYVSQKSIPQATPLGTPFAVFSSEQQQSLTDTALYSDPDTFFAPAATGEPFPFAVADWFKIPRPSPLAPEEIGQGSPRLLLALAVLPPGQTALSDPPYVSQKSIPQPTPLGSSAALFYASLAPSSLYSDLDTFFAPSATGEPFPFAVADWFKIPRPRPLAPEEIGQGSPRVLLVLAALPPGKAVLSDPPYVSQKSIPQATPLGTPFAVFSSEQQQSLTAAALYSDTETFYPPGTVGQPFPFGAVPWEALPRPPPRVQETALGTPFAVFSSEQAQNLAPPLYLDNDVFFAPIASGQPFPFSVAQWPNPNPPPRFPDLTIGNQLPLAIATQSLTAVLYTDSSEAFFSPGIAGQPFPLSVTQWPNPQPPPRFPDFVIGTRLPMVAPLQTLAPPLYSDAETFASSTISGQPFPFNAIGWDIPPRRVPVQDLVPQNVLPIAGKATLLPRAPYFTPQSRQRTYSDLSYGSPRSLLVPPLANLAPPLYTDNDSFFSSGIVGQPFPFSVAQWPDPKPAPRFPDLTIGTRLPMVVPPFNLAAPLYNDNEAFFSSALAISLLPRAPYFTPSIRVRTYGDLTYGSPQSLFLGTLNPPPFTDPDAFFTSSILGGAAFLPRAPYFTPSMRVRTYGDLSYGSPQALITATPTQQFVSYLYADDGITILTADDGVTPLTVPGVNYVSDTDAFYAASLTGGVVGTPLPRSPYFSPNPRLRVDPGTVQSAPVPLLLTQQFVSYLYADDGTTILTADDGVTPLTVPGVNYVSDADTFYASLLVGVQPLPPGWADFTISFRRPRPTDASYVQRTPLPLQLTQAVAPPLYTDSESFPPSGITGQPFPFGPVAWPNPKPSPRFPDLTVGTPISLLLQQQLGPTLYTDVETFFSDSISGQPFPRTVAQWPDPKPQPRFPDLTVAFGTRLPIVAPLGTLAPPLYTDPDALFPASISGQPFPFSPVVWPDPKSPPRFPDLVLGAFLPLAAPPQNLAPPLYTDVEAFFSPTISGQPFPFGPVSWPDPTQPRQTRDLIVSFSLPAVAAAQNLAPPLYIDAEAFFSSVVAGQPFPFAVAQWPDPKPRPRFPDLTIGTRLPMVAAAQGLTAPLYTDPEAFLSPGITGQPFPFAVAQWPDPKPPPRFPDLFYGVPLSVRAPAQTLTPSLYSDVDTLFASIFNTSANDLSTFLYTDAETFFSPALLPGAIALAPPLYTDNEAFFTAVASGQPFPFSVAAWPNPARPRQTRDLIVSFALPAVAAARNLVAPLYSDADTLFASTLTSDIEPPLYSDSDAYFSSTFTNVAELAPSLYSDVDAYFSASFATTAALAPPLYTDADIYFTIVESRDLTVSLYTDTETYFASIVAAGPVNVFGPLYSDPDIYFISSTTSGATGLTVPLYTDPESLFAPVATSGANLAPTLYADAETYFAQTAIAGPRGLDPPLYTDAEIYFGSLFTLGGAGLGPSLLVDGEFFFSAVATPGNLAVQPAALYIDADAYPAPDLFTFWIIEALPEVDQDTLYLPGFGANLVPNPALNDLDNFFHSAFQGGQVYPVDPALYRDAEVFPGAHLSHSANPVTVGVHFVSSQPQSSGSGQTKSTIRFVGD